jgi:prepilin-type N-terminal cleavage/methylation domain-containing protein
MVTTLKRSVARGFTLIELLIVVIILAILAAIAIPQFTSSTSDAQMAALDANLSAVRTALEQYKVQHTGNVYPGVNAASGAGSCPTGGAAIAKADPNSKEAILSQLQYFSNAAGAVCTVGDTTNYKYGPYLRQGMPLEPFSNSAEIKIADEGKPAAPEAGGKGWAYSATTGQFISNNSNVEATGATRKFSEH